MRTRANNAQTDRIPWRADGQAMAEYMKRYGLEADWQGWLTKAGERVAYKIDDSKGGQPAFIVVWIDPARREMVLNPTARKVTAAGTKATASFTLTCEGNVDPQTVAGRYLAQDQFRDWAADYIMGQIDTRFYRYDEEETDAAGAEAYMHLESVSLDRDSLTVESDFSVKIQGTATYEYAVNSEYGTEDVLWGVEHALTKSIEDNIPGAEIDMDKPVRAIRLDEDRFSDDWVRGQYEDIIMYPADPNNSETSVAELAARIADKTGKEPDLGAARRLWKKLSATGAKSAEGWLAQARKMTAKAEDNSVLSQYALRNDIGFTLGFVFEDIEKQTGFGMPSQDKESLEEVRRIKKAAGVMTAEELVPYIEQKYGVKILNKPERWKTGWNALTKERIERKVKDEKTRRAIYDELGTIWKATNDLADKTTRELLGKKPQEEQPEPVAVQQKEPPASVNPHMEMAAARVTAEFKMTGVGEEEYSPEQVKAAIARLEWEDTSAKGNIDLPFMQGEALNKVIQEYKLPRPAKLALYGTIAEGHGFYGAEFHYKNADLILYIADTGTETFVVAKDVTMKPETTAARHPSEYVSVSYPPNMENSRLPNYREEILATLHTRGTWYAIPHPVWGTIRNGKRSANRFDENTPFYVEFDWVSAGDDSDYVRVTEYRYGKAVRSFVAAGLSQEEAEEEWKENAASRREYGKQYTREMEEWNKQFSTDAARKVEFLSVGDTVRFLPGTYFEGKVGEIVDTDTKRTDWDRIETVYEVRGEGIDDSAAESWATADELERVTAQRVKAERVTEIKGPDGKVMFRIEKEYIQQYPGTRGKLTWFLDDAGGGNIVNGDESYVMKELDRLMDKHGIGKTTAASGDYEFYYIHTNKEHDPEKQNWAERVVDYGYTIWSHSDEFGNYPGPKVDGFKTYEAAERAAKKKAPKAISSEEEGKRDKARRDAIPDDPPERMPYGTTDLDEVFGDQDPSKVMAQRTKTTATVFKNADEILAKLPEDRKENYLVDADGDTVMVQMPKMGNDEGSIDMFMDVSRQYLPEGLRDREIVAYRIKEDGILDEMPKEWLTAGADEKEWEDWFRDLAKKRGLSEGAIVALIDWPVIGMVDYFDTGTDKYPWVLTLEKKGGPIPTMTTAAAAKETTLEDFSNAFDAWQTTQSDWVRMMTDYRSRIGQPATEQDIREFRNFHESEVETAIIKGLLDKDFIDRSGNYSDYPGIYDRAMEKKKKIDEEMSAAKLIRIGMGDNRNWVVLKVDDTGAVSVHNASGPKARSLYESHKESVNKRASDAAVRNGLKIKSMKPATAKSKGPMTDETYAVHGDSEFYRTGDQFWFSDEGRLIPLTEDQADEIRGALAESTALLRTEEDKILSVRNLVKDLGLIKQKRQEMKRMATRAELQTSHGDRVEALTRKVLSLAQAVKSIYAGPVGAVMRPIADSIGIKARQIYNETHTQNWVTASTVPMSRDPKAIRASITELEREVRELRLPLGLANVMAHRLKDELKVLKNTMDNL